MKNTLLDNDTMTIIDEPFTKNKTTHEYNDSTKLMMDALKTALKCNIGCQFVIETRYGKNKALQCIDNSYISAVESKQNTDKKIENFFDNVSLCMSDRCFRVGLNSVEQLCVIVLPMAKMKKTLWVRDKNAVVDSVISCENVFTHEMDEVTTKNHKGKRPINEDEKNKVLTAFNLMLGNGWNKPLVKKVDKDEKKTA